MDPHNNQKPSDGNSPDKNNEGQPDGEISGDLPPIPGAAMIAYGRTGDGDEKIVGALPVTVVPHGDHIHVVPEGPGIGPVESELLQLRTPEDVFRALAGDSGRSSSTTSVGYSPSYGRGWDEIFGKPANPN